MISRAWAMPCPDTFKVPPIAALIGRYLRGRSIDPFARNSLLATVRNDLNPATCATFHEPATDFLERMAASGETFDVALIDPPYSPRQMAECYQSVGKKAGTADTQNARLYAEVRRALEQIIRPEGLVLWFGWHSTGMGKAWERVETLLVCHGGAHNDTICTVDRCPARLP